MNNSKSPENRRPIGPATKTKGPRREKMPHPKKRTKKEMEWVDMREMVADIRQYQRVINAKIILLASQLKNHGGEMFCRDLLITDGNMVATLADGMARIRETMDGMPDGEAPEDLEMLLKEQELLIGRASSNVLTGKQAADVRRGLMAAQYRLTVFIKKNSGENILHRLLKTHLRRLTAFTLQCQPV